MSELLQSGQHPDADQLSAFIECALPAHEQEETLAHLAICSHCRSIVALSMPAAHPLPQQPARRPWLSGWMMVWPAGAALAALILAGIYIRSGSVVEKHVAPTLTAESAPPAPRRQLLPTPSLKLQAPGKVTPRSGPVSAAAASKTAPPLQAMDRLMPAPGGGDKTLHSNQNQVSAVSGRAATTQSATVSAGAANQAFQTERPIAGFVAAGKALAVSVRNGLPSGLPAISTVTNARQVVAIDAHYTLFSSNDAGGHWSVITQPWQGHAVKVELVSAPYPAITPNAPVAAAPVGVAGGTRLRDSAEEPKATLSGVITDPAGASIPNVSVIATNSATHAVHRTTTDSAGRYMVSELDTGNYTVQVAAPGFTPQQISGLALTAAQQTQRNLTLAIGSLAQSVEVQGKPKTAPGAPPVPEMIAVRRATVPPLHFEVTTDTGEHWTSIDGRSWQRQDE